MAKADDDYPLPSPAGSRPHCGWGHYHTTHLRRQQSGSVLQSSNGWYFFSVEEFLNLKHVFSITAEDVNKGGLLPSGLRLAATQQEAATLSASDRLDELMRRPEPGLVFTDKAFCDALTAVASTHRRLVLSHVSLWP